MEALAEVLRQGAAVSREPEGQDGRTRVHHGKQISLGLYGSNSHALCKERVKDCWFGNASWMQGPLPEADLEAEILKTWFITKVRSIDIFLCLTFLRVCGMNVLRHSRELSNARGAGVWRG